MLFTALDASLNLSLNITLNLLEKNVFEISRFGKIKNLANQPTHWGERLAP